MPGRVFWGDARQEGHVRRGVVVRGRANTRKNTMSRKPTPRTEFVLFNVVYEDGSQRSNRRVPAELLGGIDGDESARVLIEQQDREIAEKSGRPALAIKSISRVGAKPEKMMKAR